MNPAGFIHEKLGNCKERVEPAKLRHAAAGGRRPFCRERFRNSA
jgi:hypothetical protein